MCKCGSVEELPVGIVKMLLLELQLPGINRDFSLNFIKWVVPTMELHDVFYKVATKF
jgi:hypothetical protein